MTFTHFLNCTILTYSPIYVIYSACSLSDYRIGRFFIWGILYFLISSLVKMLLYATVIPYNTIESENYSISEEGLKIVINLIEVFFIIFALKMKNSFMTGSETGLKIISVGLAWTLADNFISYFLYFLTNANSDEFTWEFLQTAIKANMFMFERFGLIAIIESYRILKESNRVSIHLAFLLVLKYAYDSLGNKYLFVFDSEWENIKLRACGTVFVILLGKFIYERICVWEGKSVKSS